MSNLRMINRPAERARLVQERDRLNAQLAEARAALKGYREQFVTGDLVVTAGARKGQPYQTRGRSRWFNRLCHCLREVDRLAGEVHELSDRIRQHDRAERRRSSALDAD